MHQAAMRTLFRLQHLNALLCASHCGREMDAAVQKALQYSVCDCRFVADSRLNHSGKMGLCSENPDGMVYRDRAGGTVDRAERLSLWRSPVLITVAPSQPRLTITASFCGGRYCCRVRRRGGRNLFTDVRARLT